MEKFDKLIADERYLSLSPVDQYDVRRRFFHKVAGDPRFSQLGEDEQRDLGQRILFKGTENEDPTFFEGVKRSLYSGVQATGRHLLNVYQSLDPTQAESALQAGAGPLLAGLAVTPPAVGGEFAGEVARKTAEQMGASPETQAAIATITDFAVPGGFVPKGIRGARARAGGPLTAENIKPGAKEAPRPPSLAPEIQTRLDAMEQQLLEAEQLRRSPKGAELLRQELAEQEAKGIPARDAAVKLEEAKAAADIEGQTYVEGIGPKRAIEAKAGEIPPRADDAMAIMRGEEPSPPRPATGDIVARLEAERARQSEIPAPPPERNLQPEAASIPEAKDAMAPEPAKIVTAPQPKAGPSNEGTFRQWLSKQQISEDKTLPQDRGELLKLKQSSLKRAIVQDARPGSQTINQVVERAYQEGFIPEESFAAFNEAVDRTLRGEKVYSTQSAKFDKVSVAANEKAMIGVAADEHVRSLQEAVAGVEYKGKEYTAVIPEKGGAVRLKDSPDKVLKSPEQILQIEEKVPFDIPDEPPPPAGLRPALMMKNGEVVTGDMGKRHDSVFSQIPEAKQDAVIASGWVGPEGKFMTPDEATEWKFKSESPQLERTEAGMQAVVEGTPQKKVPDAPLKPKVEQAEGPFAIEAQPAKSVEQMSVLDLIKKGLGSETGTVGKLSPEQAAKETEARAARQELYRRLYNDARTKGQSLEQAARDSGVLQRHLKQLRVEAEQQGWNPPESHRTFTPLEREMGMHSETPGIFDKIPEELKGERLNTETIKTIKEAGIKLYTERNLKLDPDIPVTIQLARDISEKRISVDDWVAKGVNKDDLGKALLSSASNFGKGLNQLSQFSKAIKRSGIDLGEFTTEPPPSGWAYSLDLANRWINIWRGALVTQLGTAIRNAETQVARIGIDGVEKIVDGTMHDMWRLAKGQKSGGELGIGFQRAMEGFVDLAKKGKREQANEILTVFPDQKSRMFYQYASDVNAAMKEPHPLPAGVKGMIAAPFERITQSAEKAVEFANVVNRGQEFLIRKAAFRAKLAELLEKQGQNIDSIDIRALDEKMVAEAVDHALETTFAATPLNGPGKWILDVYKAVPPLYFVAPFPRFMINSWKFFTDFSPAGFVKLLSAKERAAVAAGNTKTISRAIVGTGLLGAAYGLRNSEYAGEKWYELNVGDKTIDTRPYNPFAAYLFVADVAKRANNGTLDEFGFKDLAQGLLSANFRAGTGLFMLDKVGDLLGGVISNEGPPAQAGKTIKRSIGETLAGFLTPLQTFRDVFSDERLMGLIGQEGFAKEEAKMRDVRDDPFLGPLKAKIPGLSQTLPQTQFPLGPNAEREEPATRQLSGVMLRTKTPSQKEADRLGLEQRELLSATGIEKLDRATSEIMRPIAERTLTALINSRGYQQATDVQKRVWFKKYMQDIGTQSRRVALARNPDLRIEYVIKKAGKDQGKLLREMYQRRGMIAAQ